MRSKKNKNFKRDYRDICYFIDHVRDLKLRIDLIKSLGYKIGVNVVRRGIDNEKSITVGKRNEYRIQIAPTSKAPLVQCAIID